MEPRKNKKWKLKSIFLNDFGACNRILYIYLFLKVYCNVPDYIHKHAKKVCMCRSRGKREKLCNFFIVSRYELNFRSSALIKGKGYITSFLHDVDL